MLTNDGGMLSIIDMAISLVEFVINAISSLLSGDTDALKDVVTHLVTK